MNASSLPRHPVATRTSTSGHDSHGAFPPAKSRPAQVTPSKFDGPSEEKKKTSTVTKRSWTEIEDEQLKNLVKQHGLSNWTTVADSLDGRTGKQCRERWTNHLNPGIKKGNWTDEEDRIIIEKQAELGNQWSKITEYLQGRTDNAVKNRWHSTMRSRSRNNTSHTSQVSSVNAPINITSSGHHLNPNAPANLNKRPHPAGHLNVAPKPMLAIPSFPNSTNPQLHLRKKRPNREAGYLPGAMSLKKHRPPQISIPNVPSSDSGDHVRLDDSLDPLLPFPLKPGDGEICPLTPASEKNFFNCRILSPMLSPPLVMADTHVPVTPNCMLSPLGSCMTPLPETALDEYYKSIESGSRIGTDASNKFELLSPAPLHFSTATRFQQS
uniref:Uncharacterized protein n=1 Tax=Corethron hystrix TaxID=216773 RepID=A0A7S1G206_9STRA|mmetsp:Transcript_5530/g.11510  ORF Transcript_5530/g.11510 Transcript_5530/m.11510 type:complete len:381 (+) Transcript_5530:105-1247(+)